MSYIDDLARVDLSKLSDAETNELLIAVLTLVIADHPALWLEVVGDRSYVEYDTVSEFMRLAFAEQGGDQT